MTDGQKTRKIAFMGLLTAAAMILSYVESLIPFFGGVPGMKLGLPNAAIVCVLFLFGWKEALLVNLVRIFAVGFLFGNAFSVAFSTAGALLSLLAMALLKKTGQFSMTGVSVIGGLTHNAGQILVAMAVVENVRVGYFFFPLAISGVITGLLIGLISGEIAKRLKRALEASGKRGG